MTAAHDGPKERLEKELERFKGLGPNSQKESVPAFSFGTASRELSARKVFISEKHELHKAPVTSPGPVYSPPSSIGAGAKFGFGTAEQREHLKAKYPDSSVELTCATVDSQAIKFHSTKGVHFGTESRASRKNAAVHADATLGADSPAALVYSPVDVAATRHPEYTFGAPPAGGKALPRIPLPVTASPRGLGPGSHSLPPGMGTQPNSARATAPAYGFGTASRGGSQQEPRQLLDAAPDLSSLGRQVVSSARTAPKHSFGSSTREHATKSLLVRTTADMGPRGQMPKPNFHLNLPPPSRPIAKPGL